MAVPRNDEELDGDRTNGKDGRVPAAKGSRPGTPRGVVRLTLTEPETVAMTPEQHRQAVRALSAMISSWLQRHAHDTAHQHE
jgi:hypothetical protein